MDMDRNLWLAILLSAGIYLVWFGFVDKHVNSPAARPSPAAPATPQAAIPASARARTRAAAAPELDAKEILTKSSPLRLGKSDARVSPRGAAIASFLFPGPLGPIELVDSPDPGLFSTWPELSFHRAASASGALYAATAPNGLRIRKEFLPGTPSTLPRIVVMIRNPTPKTLEAGGWSLDIGPGLGTEKSELKQNAKSWRAIGLTPKGRGLRGRIEVFKHAGDHPGPYRWVGVDNHYFLAAIAPSFDLFEPIASSLPAALTLTAKPAELAPGESRSWEIPYYLGPKDDAALKSYGIGLDRAIDFGFFAQLGRAMLSALEYIHRTVGNWGWAIILLTLALQLVLFPLTWKSLRAAAAMRKLQPEIARLQKLHANDPKTLNAEMMGLYKKTGANPLGGCLPMLLQMPIFIALYNTLRNSWELHGAGWALWIRDLSAKDPYYVLPLVMGALMYLQSKLNPPSADPSQQQIMMFMPVIFTVMFLRFPSGLVLYWLTNSLVSTLLQLALQERLNA